MLKSSKEAASFGSDQKQWYAVRSATGYEGRVVKSLKHFIALKGLEKYFGDMLVPVEEVVEMRGGEKRKSQRKFYPGYVFINMCMNDETWYLVKSIPKVLGFVGGTRDEPAPISEREISAILNRVEAGIEKPKPKFSFEPGEVVRVVEGPFADFDATVEEVSYDKNRLRVSVSIFGRLTSVELDFSQIKKA